MKILFLQNVDNAKGGIATVNLKLMSYFLSLNLQVDVISIRHGNTWDQINYPDGTGIYLINDKDLWGTPRLNECLMYIKHGKIGKAMGVLLKRFVHKRKMRADYRLCSEKIEALAPDVIINSHYEILQGISPSYLRKTIMHFHTSFDQVMDNNSYQRIFKKYADKLYSFVWLSKKTKEEAVEYGFKNSTYIYNPISFSESSRADMNNKKMIFLGRLSEEKRIHLAIEYFREVVKENGLSEWDFEIYGDGPLKQELLLQIKDDSRVHYRGRTDNVKEVLLKSSVLILTSEFEGMPLVVLEANECGVPAIVYDFGESSCEVVKNGETGVIVPQNDKQAFKQELKRLLEDKAYRESLSKSANNFAKNFSVENMGQQWLELFDRMEK